MIDRLVVPIRDDHNSTMETVYCRMLEAIDTIVARNSPSSSSSPCSTVTKEDASESSLPPLQGARMCDTITKRAAQLTDNQRIELVVRLISIFAGSALPTANTPDDTLRATTLRVVEQPGKVDSVDGEFSYPASFIIDTCGTEAALAGSVSVLQQLQQEPQQQREPTKQTTPTPTTSLFLLQEVQPAEENEPTTNETPSATPMPLRPSRQSILGVVVPLLHILLFGTEPDDDDRTTVPEAPQLKRTIWWPLSAQTKEIPTGRKGSAGTLPQIAPPSSWIIPHILALPGLLCGAAAMGRASSNTVVTTTWLVGSSNVDNSSSIHWGHFESMVSSSAASSSSSLHSFHQALVAAAAASVMEAAATESSLRGTTNETSIAFSEEATTTLWSLLVTSLLRRQRGDRNVVSGLLLYFRSHSSNFTAATAAVVIAVERTLLARLPTKEAVLIARVCLQQYLASLKQRPSSPVHRDSRSSSLVESEKSVWLRTVGQSILQRHSSAVCQLVVMSPSSVAVSPKSHAQVDGRLCQLLAKLYSNIVIKDDTEPSSTDTADNESDSGSEGSITATNDGSVWRDMQQLPPWKRLLYQHVCIVADSWATTSFVRRWDALLQHHVTVFILAGLNELQKQHTPDLEQDMSLPLSLPADELELFQQSQLVARLMQGVTIRLGTSNADAIRRDGMQVGEQIAVLLGLDLTFEELLAENRLDGDVAPETGRLGGAEPMAHATNKVRKKLPALRKKDWDPDAIHDPSDDDESDNSDAESVNEADDDSEWDEIDTPYSLEDDMDDLRDVPRPLYLSECLDYLRTAESDENIYSRHESALREISSLVRLRPADLVDLGPELARSVLRLENKFNMDQFTELVADSLCSLTVADPAAVGLNLIAELFQECTLSDRLTVLRTLDVAAWELSGVKTSPVTGVENPTLPKLPSSRVSGKRELVPSTRNDNDAIVAERSANSDDGRTRRWGRGRSESATGYPKPIDNQFGRVAPIWFYALMGNFLERKDDPVLWGDEVGATLLSNVFMTLGRIVWFTGPNTPGVDILAKDLFDIVWPFRNAEIAAVRNSVLSTTGMIIGCLHQDTILSLLRDSSDEGLARGLQLLSETDSDNDCRSAAQAVAHAVKSTLNMVDSPLFLN